MELVLEQVLLSRGGFRLRADAVFDEGLHLVSGRVGAGKSTLALAIGGGLAPTKGRIAFSGTGRRLLIQQFTEFHLTGATLEAEIASWGLVPGPLLARLGLDAGNDPFRLSRGEQKRLVLASALDIAPDLLVLDEPFASCDLREKRRLGRALEERVGVTVVLTNETPHLPSPDSAWTIREGALCPDPRAVGRR